uniref:Uncharacterized protein n=1 Tax=Avena sativa TaxID=4498 RepID=A0ACD6ASH8_AVESA
MAARSLFHCSAPRSVPQPLRIQRNKFPNAHLSSSGLVDNLIPAMQNASVSSYGQLKTDGEIFDRDDDDDTSQISSWLESLENQEWLSWIGGTSQDAVASNIIVAAAFVVWYPSIVKVKLAKLVVNQLIKLVMSMNDRYSSTAAELLAEGMQSTWKACLGTDIAHFLSDVLFQIECLSSAPSNNAIYKTAVAVTMREALYHFRFLLHFYKYHDYGLVEISQYDVMDLSCKAYVISVLENLLINRRSLVIYSKAYICSCCKEVWHVLFCRLWSRWTL